MTDTVGLLTKCLGLPSAGFSRRHFQATFGDDGQAMLDLGIFSPTVCPDDIDCPCAEGHGAVPRWIAKTSAYHVSCYRGRLYRLDPLDVEVHAFNARRFQDAVAEALGLAKPNRSSQADGAVRYVGDALFGTTLFPILFIADLRQPENLDALLLADFRRTGHTSGLILTSEPTGERLRADCLHAIVTPEEVLDFEDGRFRRRPKVLRFLLKDVIKKMPVARAEALLCEVASDFREVHGDWLSGGALKELATKLWPEDQQPPGRSICYQTVARLKAGNA